VFSAFSFQREYSDLLGKYNLNILLAHWQPSGKSSF